MPKLSKVQKKVAKKRKDISSLHENSRDAVKLRRAAARADKLEKLSVARNKANDPHGRDSPSGTQGFKSADDGIISQESSVLQGSSYRS